MRASFSRNVLVSRSAGSTSALARLVLPCDAWPTTKPSCVVSAMPSVKRGAFQRVTPVCTRSISAVTSGSSRWTVACISTSACVRVDSLRMSASWRPRPRKISAPRARRASRVGGDRSGNRRRAQADGGRALDCGGLERLRTQIQLNAPFVEQRNKQHRHPFGFKPKLNIFEDGGEPAGDLLNHFAMVHDLRGILGLEQRHDVLGIGRLAAAQRARSLKQLEAVKHAQCKLRARGCAGGNGTNGILRSGGARCSLMGSRKRANAG